MILSLKELAKACEIHDGDLRILDNKIISIAGPVGHVDSHLQVKLRLEALSIAARDAAQECLDAGFFSADERGRLFVNRLPHIATEVRLFQRCLGLDRRSSCVKRAVSA